jgi:hypothetical protein
MMYHAWFSPPVIIALMDCLVCVFLCGSQGGDVPRFNVTVTPSGSSSRSSRYILSTDTTRRRVEFADVDPTSGAERTDSIVINSVPAAVPLDQCNGSTWRNFWSDRLDRIDTDDFLQIPADVLFGKKEFEL